MEMTMNDATVRAWKAYAPTAGPVSGPVLAIDVEDVARGGVIGSWAGTFSCCDTTICAGCTIW